MLPRDRYHAINRTSGQIITKVLFHWNSPLLFPSLPFPHLFFSPSFPFSFSYSRNLFLQESLAVLSGVAVITRSGQRETTLVYWIIESANCTSSWLWGVDGTSLMALDSSGQDYFCPQEMWGMCNSAHWRHHCQRLRSTRYCLALTSSWTRHQPTCSTYFLLIVFQCLAISAISRAISKACGACPPHFLPLTMRSLLWLAYPLSCPSPTHTTPLQPVFSTPHLLFILLLTNKHLWGQLHLFDHFVAISCYLFPVEQPSILSLMASACDASSWWLCFNILGIHLAFITLTWSSLYFTHRHLRLEEVK